MIRSTQIDLVALELHVSSQLQLAISAVNNVAQSEARAAAEAHAVQHAHMSDVRMQEGFKQLQHQLHTNFEQRMREVLSAHMEQVNAEIQLTIATQDKEMLKIMQQQMAAFQQEMSTHLDEAKRCVERKAKSIVRIHHAEENAAHAAIETSLLQTMAKFKASTIAETIRHMEERIRLASTFELAQMITDSQTHGSPETRLESFQPVQTAEPSVNVEAGGGTGAGIAASDLAMPSEKSTDFAQSCIQEQESDEVSARIMQERDC
ncbi:hypothetical protein V7S43_011129 [Phytophthora oleae]|uniref:Uncharacterized protein n=1 Tax=Phytophthora oleae TaxID=2107226 RepID=A0ABD3FDZ6_9STRA